jgi:hypothetical protein
VVAQWCNVLITHWSDTPTVPPLEVCQKASFELASRFPPGIVVFNVITSNITLPSAEVRKKSSEVLATTGGHVRCTATIILGEGFWASAARAMLAGITLMSRQRHPHKVFGSIADAAAWCEPRLLPEGTRPADLVAVLARLGTQP